MSFTSFDANERTELGAVLRSSDVVSLQSDYQANPVAMMEVLALWRKVVVAGTSGLSEPAPRAWRHQCPGHPSRRVDARTAGRVVHPRAQARTSPDWDCADQLLGLSEEVLLPLRER